MSAYDKYKDLLDLPYIPGRQDCYGLLRKYYSNNYGLKLRNYARPSDFADTIDLISENFLREGFEIMQIPLTQLLVGDGLLLRLNNRRFVNHVGAFVGNGFFLHHLYNRLSSADALTPIWLNRITTVVRHPEVTEQNKVVTPEVNFMDILAPHLKVQHGTV